MSRVTNPKVIEYQVDFFQVEEYIRTRVKQIKATDKKEALQAAIDQLPHFFDFDLKRSLQALLDKSETLDEFNHKLKLKKIRCDVTEVYNETE